jgi:hypothetical protein
MMQLCSTHTEAQGDKRGVWLEMKAESLETRLSRS